MWAGFEGECNKCGRDLIAAVGVSGVAVVGIHVDYVDVYGGAAGLHGAAAGGADLVHVVPIQLDAVGHERVQMRRADLCPGPSVVAHLRSPA